MTDLCLFDLDGTLVDRSSATRRWAAQIAEAVGRDSSFADAIVTYDNKGHTSRDALYNWIVGRQPSTEWVEFAEALYLETFKESVLISPALLEGLRSAGFQIVVATNGVRARQRAKLEAAKLSRYVLDVVTPAEVDTSKPDPEFFRRAARRFGARLAWVVGDSPVDDVVAADAAGLDPLWVSWGLDWPDGLPRKGHQFVTVNDAVTFLLTTVVGSPRERGGG